MKNNISSLSEELKDAINRYMPQLLVSVSVDDQQIEMNNNILSREMKDAIDRFIKIIEVKLAVKNTVHNIF